MYAVIRTGGKQYRVSEGDTLEIETITGEPGAAVTFDDVLLVGSEEETRIGTPTVDGASVAGTIVNHGNGEDRQCLSPEALTALKADKSV